VAILRARRDIEKDSEILTRYWHKEKDAWQNVFECECCACTNHTGTTTNPTVETADTTAIEGPVLTVEYAPRQRPDIENPGHDPSQTHSAINNQDYPDSEMDDWEWDALEASPLKGNRVYRLYSEGWQTGKELLNGLQTVDKRRNNQRPSEQYAQPLLESKIYLARRTRIEAPARSTILRRVGLLEALSSAARGP